MYWIIILLGAIVGFFGTANLLIALIHHLPYAIKLSKTHKLAVAQKINGKLDIWYGPVPYGRIFTGPIMFSIVFAGICVAIYFLFPAYRDGFAIGIGIAIVLILIGLPDSKGKYKRDLHLFYGNNYVSNAGIVGVYSLKDEQIYFDNK